MRRLSVSIPELVNLKNVGIERALTSMREELERPGVMSDRMGHALAQQLAIGLLRLLTEDHGPVAVRGGLRPSQLRIAIGLIERNLHADLSVSQLAA